MVCYSISIYEIHNFIINFPAAAKDADFKAMIPTTGEKNCNPISGFMVTCINGQVFKNCPVDQQTNFDAECLKLSTFADTCGMKIGKGK